MSVGLPMGFPLRYVRRNILFGRQPNDVAALYRLPMISYPFMPDDDKKAWLTQMAGLAFTVQADFSLWRVNREYPAARYPAQVAGLLDGRYADRDAWRMFLAGQARHLGGLRAHLPEVYLAVSLSDSQVGRFGQGFFRSLDRARRRMEDTMGVGSASPLSGTELEALAIAERRVFERLSFLRPARASTSEIQWLLRRSGCRGVAEPDLSEFWRPDALVVAGDDGDLAYTPLSVDLARTMNMPLHETRGERATGQAPFWHLVADAEEGRSYQAMLGLDGLPEDPTFPGARAELLFAPLEAVDFPVDAVLHAEWIGNRAALSQVRKRIMDAENVYREQVEGSAVGPGWIAEENRAISRELEAYLQSESHPPMVKASIGLAVGAATLDELKRHVDILREQFGDVTLRQPAGLQARLFYDHALRADGGQVGDWDEHLTIEQFGALMPVGTHRVGSTSGLYIGYTPMGRRPVKFDITEASRESRPSAILFAGTLGSGKTVSAELIAYQAERRGSLVVDVDPKPDHNFEGLPELAGRVDVIELSGAEEFRGALDPLRIAPESIREEITSSYMTDLLKSPPPAWENAIDRAVKDAVRARETSSLAVLERLRRDDREGARDAAEALENQADFGFGRLGFGVGGDDTVEAAAPITTIKASGLSLPEAGVTVEHYSRSQRVAVATLSLLAAYALRLVSTDRTRHKIVLFDEAWFLLASAQGRTLFNQLVRTGRALNATIIVATQRLADVGELENLVGTRFVFGQETDEEARTALRLLGLDPEDRSLVQQVKSYRKGLCLMRDLHGRTAEVQIDHVFPHLLETFDTSPKRQQLKVTS
ncbi:MAG: ATP-binding protein [Chloroflexi bacterium]|nr:ATP-binding protein [Chloroflexota bacterium]